MTELEPGDLPVYRTTPLPRGHVRGRYLVASEVIASSREVFREVALRGIRDGGHEALVFWAGVEAGGWTAITTVVVPDADHSPGRVHVDEDAYGRAAAEAGDAGVALLAQVHTHPGRDVRHSEGDDGMIVLPFEGMLSIVVPEYGWRWRRLGEAGIHQFQEGRWVLCSEESVADAISVAPLVVDSRREA